VNTVPGHFCKYYTGVGIIAKEKYSSLLAERIFEKEKKFYNIDTNPLGLLFFEKGTIVLNI